MSKSREYSPMRELPAPHKFSSKDVLVLFGELFEKGYANGIVAEAEKAGMKVIYGTVGRRDKNQQLRALTESELKEKNQSPLIPIPLEAGFDLTPDSKGVRPVDQLKGVKLSGWTSVKMDWSSIEESRAIAQSDFRQRVQSYMLELKKEIPRGANIVFVHTMAGGVPRAKIMMPAMNRVFKGHGDRYASSSDFWSSDLGRFAEASFEEVTARTLEVLIEESAEIRAEAEASGQKVSYLAYGYHGTDVFIKEKYQWQSYSPYLQGFAKIELEEIAIKSWEKGVRVSVFNAPEILTNSSSIFLGVEVSLYPLLGALVKEAGLEGKKKSEELLGKFQSDYTLSNLMNETNQYFCSPTIQEWSKFDEWPQHNGPEQMSLMREASDHLIKSHRDEKDLVTSALSEIVFSSCGHVMLRAAANPEKPVWWIGHDLVAKSFAEISRV